MNGKLLWGLAICVVAPLCTGCASYPGVVRGQSPSNGADQPATVQSAPAQQVGPGVVTEDGVCPECGCRDGSCRHRCHLPHHELWYHYTPPDRVSCCGCDPSCWNGYCACRQEPLVYPPNPSPGAIVQYPYYTCKGPDDFFHPALTAQR